MSDAKDVNNKMVATTEGLTSDAFHRLLDLAITGRGKLLGARAIANNQLRHQQNHEDAIRGLSNQHIALAGGQGFATNWGGFLLSLVTIPANMAAAAFIQARAVAGIAHLRGSAPQSSWSCLARADPRLSSRQVTCPAPQPPSPPPPPSTRDSIPACPGLSWNSR